MNYTMGVDRVMPRAALTVLILVLAATAARGQESIFIRAARETESAPAAGRNSVKRDSLQTTSSAAKHNFFRDLAAEEKAIWLSPARIGTKDLSWLAPLAAGTAVLIINDRDISGGIREDGGVARTSRIVSHLGDAYSSIGAAGAFYLIGKISNNERARETGELGIRALIHSAAVATVIKVATDRQRPNEDNGAGHFWAARSRFDSSFISLHASTTWALATVIAEEYDDIPAVRWGAYGWAAIVSVSRVTGKRHFSSDVLVGAVFGHLIGRYVVRRNQRAGVIPVISAFETPAIRGGRRSGRGLKMAWTF